MKRLWGAEIVLCLNLLLAFCLVAVGQVPPARKKNAPQPGAEPPPISLEEAAKVEADRVKREQNINHMRKINNEAMDAFKANGMTEDCAKLAVSLIAKKLSPNVSIES